MTFVYTGHAHLVVALLALLAVFHLISRKIGAKMHTARVTRAFVLAWRIFRAECLST